MPSEFQKIASCATAHEADHLRVVLEEHGIRAFVEGADLKTSLSYYGSALGDVSVVVRACDAEAALDVVDKLIEDQAGHSETEPWFCAACNETIDGGFEVCWKCGEHRSEVEGPMPEVADEAREPEEVSLADNNPQPLPTPDQFDESNPFASPRTKPGSTQAAMSIEFSEEAEANLVRAWRASIFGFVGLPVLANFYSMYLLLTALKQASHFSPEGNRRFYGALAINILLVFILGVIWQFGSLFFSYSE
ncbi:hypothetical protein GC197_12960 [bacterium]|nr:hypothetical protein [bacterium]